MQFYDALRRPFVLGPDTHDEAAAQYEARPPYPYVEPVHDLSLGQLLGEPKYMNAFKDFNDSKLDQWAANVVHVAVDKQSAPQVSRFPNLQSLSYVEQKSSVFPKELSGLETLRVFTLDDARKFAKLPKELTSYPNLEALNLQSMRTIKDISLLSSLPHLRYIKFYNTLKIDDYSPLLEVTDLRHLVLASIDYEKVAPTVEQLGQLDALEIQSSLTFDSQLDRFEETLRALPHLKKLGLQSASLRGRPLSVTLEDLTELDLSGASDITPELFTATPALRALNLPHYRGEALPTSLATLTQLEALDLDFLYEIEQDADFSPIAALSNLKHLKMNARKFTKIPKEFGQLKKLEQLELSSAFTDLSALHGLPSLHTLAVYHLTANDEIIALAKSLPNLKRLLVNDTIDISPLADHPSLLYVSGGQKGGEREKLFKNFYSVAYLRR